MRITTKLLLILAVLVLAPYRFMAQETTHDCPNPLPVDYVCIDSITAAPGNVSVGGGEAIVAHWIAFAQQDFFQIRYALPGGQDTQVKLGGGSEGVYNLQLGATAGGNYTFKVQGCLKAPTTPSTCLGGDQQPWDIEVYALTPPPAPVAVSKRPTCPAGLKLTDSPCTCSPGLNQPSACDPAGTEDCLSTAQVSKVPNAPARSMSSTATCPRLRRAMRAAPGSTR
jgi:hypothetical protein